MRVHRHHAMMAATVLIASLVCSIFGCGEGGSDDAAAAASNAPAVDPRFATAEAIAQAFTNLQTLSREEAGPAFVAMFYAENEWQEQWLAIDRARIQVHRADQAMHARFGVSIRETGDHYYTPFLANAVLEDVSESRATARMEKAGLPPSVAKLYFIKADGRWWISLYTFEYLFTENGLDRAIREAQIFHAMAAGAEALMTGLRANQYATAAEARSAFVLAMQLYALEHPELLNR